MESHGYLHIILCGMKTNGVEIFLIKKRLQGLLWILSFLLPLILQVLMQVIYQVPTNGFRQVHPNANNEIHVKVVTRPTEIEIKLEKHVLKLIKYGSKWRTGTIYQGGHISGAKSWKSFLGIGRQNYTKGRRDASEVRINMVHQRVCTVFWEWWGQRRGWAGSQGSCPSLRTVWRENILIFKFKSLSD